MDEFTQTIKQLPAWWQVTSNGDVWLATRRWICKSTSNWHDEIESCKCEIGNGTYTLETSNEYS